MPETRTRRLCLAEAESSPALHDFIELTKPRLSLMSVATAILGYFAAGPELNQIVFFSLAGGTSLAAFGAATLNQWWEREADAKMNRTADRPLAAGRMSPELALGYGLALSVVGVGLIWWGIDWLTAALTAATVGLYILAYTPLKKVTPWATEIGAIPGALPPLIGWVAAGAGFSTMGWILFGILFAWQIPHFMAISWNCRDEYAEAGFSMLAIEDKTGRTVGRRAFLWTVFLVLLSLAPVGKEGIGWPLAFVALLLGYQLLKPALAFARGRSINQAARKLFFATLIYLPVYLGALVVDRFFI